MPQSELPPHDAVLVVSPDVVRNALRKLSERTVHKAFGGYLAILRTATDCRSLGPLTVRFKDFFEAYYAVEGSSSKWPYYVPFGNAGDVSGRFFNRNVAGSYAPSSIRPVSPLRKLAIIDTSSSGVTFELAEDHAATARDLLGRKSIPGASLAAYLYRDYGFPPGSDVRDLYGALERDFGFAFEYGSVRFSEIFHDDTSDLGIQALETLEVHSGQ